MSLPHPLGPLPPGNSQVSAPGTQVNRFGPLRPRGLRGFMRPFLVAQAAPISRLYTASLTQHDHMRWFVDMPPTTNWTGLTDYTVVLGRWVEEFGAFVVESTTAGITASKEFTQEYRGDPLALYVSAITGTPPVVPVAADYFRIWHGGY